jgi:hypothetical protein
VSLSDEEAKADAIYHYYNSILGTYFARTRNVSLASLQLPQLELDALAAPFTVDEIWGVIKEIPNDRAPGPEGFTDRFYKYTWPVIRNDVVAVFNAVWALDGRSLSTLNTANMVLLRKMATPSHLKDYSRPKCLIHSVGKLVTKVVANRLAPHLPLLVRNNQSAFIHGRSIHDNYMVVQLACRWMHSRHCPAVLIKVDITKAFDSVSRSFSYSSWPSWASPVIGRNG